MVEQNPNPNGEQNIDIQAELEKARKQERDKLHADIDRLKNDLAEKAKTCNENYITISNLQKELGSARKEIQDFENKLAKAKEDGKMESNQELENVKKELEEYKSKLAQAEKEFADYKSAEEVKAYRISKLADIDDEFKELVKGSSKEEIDASYEQVKSLQNTVKEKYSKKEQLPTPKTNPTVPKKTSDLIEKLKGMSAEEYKEARKRNFK